ILASVDIPVRQTRHQAVPDAIDHATTRLPDTVSVVRVGRVVAPRSVGAVGESKVRRACSGGKVRPSPEGQLIRGTGGHRALHVGTRVTWVYQSKEILAGTAARDRSIPFEVSRQERMDQAIACSARTCDVARDVGVTNGRIRRQSGED